MSGSRIAVIEYALPSRVVSNQELELAHPTWRMGDVQSRTGVMERRWAGPAETSLDLAQAACERLFAERGVDRGSIDGLLFCTQSPDYVMPPNACLLQHNLGLRQGVAALDFSLACSGFVYGLYLAHGMIAAGSATNVLVVTAETYSKLFHQNDRGPATLFGDAAAATLVTAAGAGSAGMSGFVMGTDGSGGRCFYIPEGGARAPRGETRETKIDAFGNERGAADIYMDGAAVLAFVKREIPSLAAEVLRRAGHTMDDMDLVLVHQASRLGLNAVYDALAVPASKQFTNIERVGNTVSASVPILMRDAELAGRLTPGMRVLTLAFGVGWSWAGCVVRW